MNKLLNNLKSKNIKTALVIVLLIALCAGISFAAYNYTSNASDNSLKSGQITMTYTEPSNTVILKDALPKEDELGKNQAEYFEFSVMSNATTNESDDKGVKIPYEISISKVAVDANLKQLEDKDVKIYLTKLEGEKEEEVLGPILISELEASEYDQESFKIYDTKNHHKNNNGSITTKYRIRFWVDENVDVSAWATTGEYEYKFKVNVNGKAEELKIENTLVELIRNDYTDNLMKDDNGNEFLVGEESSSDYTPSEQLLSIIGTYSGVYLYREEIDDDNVKPVSNIKQVADTKKYTYNQSLLDEDIKKYFIESGAGTEAQYNQMVGPFGGYVNVVVGMAYGMVDGNNMTYVEGYTIDDIPSLDESMLDENVKPSIVEMLTYLVSETLPYSKDSFIKLYSTGKDFNEELLNSNLELGIVNFVSQDIIEKAKTNFGSILNYCKAHVVEIVDNDNITFIEGKTINDIPSLKDILEEKIKSLKINRNYIRLNNVLYEVIGINKDDSVNLIETKSYVASTMHQSINIDNYLPFYYHGILENDKYGFAQTIKGTTLGKIIIPRTSEYFIYDENEELLETRKINGYSRLMSYEEIEKTFKNDTSFITTNSQQYYGLNKFMFKDNEYLQQNTKIHSGSGLAGLEYFTEYNTEYYYFKPIITIKNINVKGMGSKTAPYYIENEKILTIEQIVIDHKNYIDSHYTGPSNKGDYVSSFNSIGVKYGSELDRNNSYYLRSVEDDFTLVGIKIEDQCYYAGNDNIVIKKELVDGGCPIKPLPQFSKQPTSVSTYEMAEVVFSAEATNVDSYQWQQKVSGEWMDVEDLTGRISGSNTNTLTIIPTNVFHEITEFRCLAINETGAKRSSVATMTLTLSDGEWEYKEIGDTNKYRIINYIGDHTNSTYFTQNKDDEKMYDLVFPEAINGNIIEEIESVGVSFSMSYKANSTWKNIHSAIKTIKLPVGIKRIYSYMYTPLTTEVKLNEGLEIIGSHVFDVADINEIKFPSTLKIIGYNSFRCFAGEKLVIPDSVERIEGYAFYLAGKLKELTLPEGLEFIGYNAFENAKLTKLTIPNTVVEIGHYAFSQSPITQIELGQNLESIGFEAFYSAQLTELTLPNKIKMIDGSAFYSSQLTKLNLPNELENIGSAAFYSSKLTELKIPEKVKLIDANAFYSSEINELEIPASVEKIDLGAFYSSPLTKLTLHEGLQSIESTYSSSGQTLSRGAFASAQLTELKLPSSLLTIESNAFYNSRFTDLKIYGKTSLSDFTTLGENAIIMADGYEPQFIEGTLE